MSHHKVTLVDFASLAKTRSESPISFELEMKQILRIKCRNGKLEYYEIRSEPKLCVPFRELLKFFKERYSYYEMTTRSGAIAVHER